MGGDLGSNDIQVIHLEINDKIHKVQANDKWREGKHSSGSDEIQISVTT